MNRHGCACVLRVPRERAYVEKPRDGMRANRGNARDPSAVGRRLRVWTGDSGALSSANCGKAPSYASILAQVRLILI